MVESMGLMLDKNRATSAYFTSIPFLVLSEESVPLICKLVEVLQYKWSWFSCVLILLSSFIWLLFSFPKPYRFCPLKDEKKFPCTFSCFSTCVYLLYPIRVHIAADCDPG